MLFCFFFDIHVGVLGSGLVFADKEHIVASDEDLAYQLLLLALAVVYHFVRVVELEIHVVVDGDQRSFVFCLIPLEPDNDLLVDQRLQERLGIYGLELEDVSMFAVISCTYCLMLKAIQEVFTHKHK